jgi:catechol 2,3-dioxygenase-like lactoylglutathione lyase family enzyme
MSETSKRIPAPALSETILKTGRFDEMKDWYSIALDMEPFFVRGRPEKVSWTKSQQIAFFKLHGSYPYAQMFGIFEIDGTAAQIGNDPGLHHFQLAHGNFDELFKRYDRLKAKRILPVQTWNHGVMTSFYYEDPDGNQAEMTCVNFAREEDFRAYFETDAYKKNISGIKINPDDYITRYRAGTSREELVKIPD